MHRSRLLARAAAAAILMVGCSAGDLVSPGRTIQLEVSGRVLSASDGTPIPGARVTLGDEYCLYVFCDLGLVAAATTHSDGSYQLRGSVESCDDSVSALLLGVAASALGHEDTGSVTAHCTPSAQTFTLYLYPTSHPAPVPIAPVASSVVVQNEPSTGCVEHPVAGSGFRIAFDWTDVTLTTGRASYRIQVEGEEAGLIVDQELGGGSSEFALMDCGFVMDSKLDGWTWRVRMSGPIASEWSEFVPFAFAPCRLPTGALCKVDAPILVAPADGALISQNEPLSCGAGVRRVFDWTDVPVPGTGTRYRIVVQRENAQGPAVDSIVEASEYDDSFCGYIIPDNQQGWQWRVRVETRTMVSDWSEYRSFEYGPL